jgi:hypothetical protein
MAPRNSAYKQTPHQTIVKTAHLCQKEGHVRYFGVWTELFHLSFWFNFHSNRLHILLSEKNEAHIPACEINPRRSLHSTLKKYMTV